MKIDKDKLAAMLARDDESLWREIRNIAKGHGFNLPETTPPHSEMEKLRCAVGDGSKLSPRDAVKIINNLRKGTGK